jgi:hypothetical protein
LLLGKYLVSPLGLYKSILIFCFAYSLHAEDIRHQVASRSLLTFRRNILTISSWMWIGPRKLTGLTSACCSFWTCCSKTPTSLIGIIFSKTFISLCIFQKLFLFSPWEPHIQHIYMLFPLSLHYQFTVHLHKEYTIYTTLIYIKQRRCYGINTCFITFNGNTTQPYEGVETCCVSIKCNKASVDAVASPLFDIN